MPWCGGAAGVPEAAGAADVAGGGEGGGVGACDAAGGGSLLDALRCAEAVGASADVKTAALRVMERSAEDRRVAGTARGVRTKGERACKFGDARSSGRSWAAEGHSASMREAKMRFACATRGRC